MADSITLDILTPIGPRRQGVTAPGVEIPGLLGELGVLPGHETFITAIVPGVVRFRQGDLSVRMAVGTGFVEVTADGRVVVLVDRALEAQEIDADAARKRLAEVGTSLASDNGPILSAGHRALTQERAWLEAQLRVAGPDA